MFMLQKNKELMMVAQSFYELMKARKSCRHFSNQTVDIDLLNLYFSSRCGPQRRK